MEQINKTNYRMAKDSKESLKPYLTVYPSECEESQMHLLYSQHDINWILCYIWKHFYFFQTPLNITQHPSTSLNITQHHSTIQRLIAHFNSNESTSPPLFPKVRLAIRGNLLRKCRRAGGLGSYFQSLVGK